MNHELTWRVAAKAVATAALLWEANSQLKAMPAEIEEAKRQAPPRPADMPEWTDGLATFLTGAWCLAPLFLVGVAVWL